MYTVHCTVYIVHVVYTKDIHVRSISIGVVKDVIY